MKDVEEDYERLSEIDRMYLIEKENEMIYDWQQWTEYDERQPAKINIVKINKDDKRRENEKSKRVIG